MPDASRDLAPHQAIRLADYEPPAFLIDRVDLAFALGEDTTTVRARLGVRRNPEAAEQGTPLKLDGEEMELVSLALDGAALGENRYRLEPEFSSSPTCPTASRSRSRRASSRRTTRN